MNGLVSDNWSERVPAGEARPDASDTRRRASGMIPYWYAIHQSYASIHGLTSIPLPVWGGTRTDLLDGMDLTFLPSLPSSTPWVSAGTLCNQTESPFLHLKEHSSTYLVLPTGTAINTNQSDSRLKPIVYLFLSHCSTAGQHWNLANAAD